MDFFDRHKALILTVLCCGILILGLINFRLSQYKKESTEMMVNLDQLKPEEKTPEEKKEEEPPKPKAQKTKTVETHRAFNENQEERKENFDRQLDEILKKNSAKQEQSSKDETKAGEVSLPKKSEENKKKSSQGNDQSEELANKEGGIRNSSISFSLRGRRAIDIPNPVYTCDVAGRIVVNITVNAGGMVEETTFNKASSSSTNECLIEQALKYASGARFSPLPGRDEQPGTITYQFEP
ncbi:MAG: energy transducer TonB [Salegentibacter sp.]